MKMPTIFTTLYARIVQLIDKALAWKAVVFWVASGALVIGKLPAWAWLVIALANISARMLEKYLEVLKAKK